MALQGTDPESYIAENTSVYEENLRSENGRFGPPVRVGGRVGPSASWRSRSVLGVLLEGLPF